jgi:leucyl aminopeptidase (aminopeptidase T)
MYIEVLFEDGDTVEFKVDEEDGAKTVRDVQVRDDDSKLIGEVDWKE